MNNDPWIEDNSPIEPEKLHALGAITFNWNSSEMGLFYLFCNVSGMTGRQARIMVHDTQLPAICDRIKNFVELKTFPDDIKNSILHAVALFDANRINRNQLTHFLPSGGEEGVEFWRNAGPTIERIVVPSNIENIRRIATEIIELNKYQVGVANHLSALSYNQKPPPLPEKPQIPERLWKPPNPQRKPSRKKSNPPPQPSEA